MLPGILGHSDAGGNPPIDVQGRIWLAEPAGLALALSFCRADPITDLSHLSGRWCSPMRILSNARQTGAPTAGQPLIPPPGANRSLCAAVLHCGRLANHVWGPSLEADKATRALCLSVKVLGGCGSLVNSERALLLRARCEPAALPSPRAVMLLLCEPPSRVGFV